MEKKVTAAWANAGVKARVAFRVSRKDRIFSIDPNMHYTYLVQTVLEAIKLITPIGVSE